MTDILNQIIKYHKDRLEACKIRAVYYDAAESPQWSRETEDREYNKKLIQLHTDAITFLEGERSC